jgi:tight adherence protein B
MFGLDTNTLAFIALAGFSGAALVYAFLFQKIEEENRTDKRLKTIQSSEADRSVARSAKDKTTDANRRRKAVQDNIKDLEDRQKNREKMIQRPPLRIQMQQAGMSGNMRKFYIISAVSAVLACIAYFLGGGPLLGLPGAALVFGVGLPRWYVSFARKRRIKKFLEEFPNSIDIIVRAVKSGLPLNDGLRLIANEAKEPVRSEFQRILDQQQIGLSIPEAAGKLYETMPCPEANFFGIVIQIQAAAGGNLSEALGNLSRVLRDRKKMKAKVAALSMEAKASAAIIGALPFIVTLLVYLSSPDYMMLLFTTDTGHMLIGIGLAWMSIGVMVMKKMINFDM